MFSNLFLFFFNSILTLIKVCFPRFDGRVSICILNGLIFLFSHAFNALIGQRKKKKKGKSERFDGANVLERVLTFAV